VVGLELGVVVTDAVREVEVLIVVAGLGLSGVVTGGGGTTGPVGRVGRGPLLVGADETTGTDVEPLGVGLLGGTTAVVLAGAPGGTTGGAKGPGPAKMSSRRAAFAVEATISAMRIATFVLICIARPRSWIMRSNISL
jgi:hypothetical protein